MAKRIFEFVIGAVIVGVIFVVALHFLGVDLKG